MIFIDLWGGDLHTNHIGHHEVEEWADASAIMLMAIENGFVCNVVHSDFEVPEHRRHEQDEIFRKSIEQDR